MDNVPKKKTVSVNFCPALFSFLDFLVLEDGADRLFQNAGREFPVHAV